MQGPKLTPQDLNVNFDKDFHLVYDPVKLELNVWRWVGGEDEGEKIIAIPSVAKGIAGRDWRRVGADTPPGLYRLGTIWNDYADGTLLPAYGWVTFDMIDLEGNEDESHRSGIALHGGGSGLLKPQDPYQQLTATHGCVRCHNMDLRDVILPLVSNDNTVFISIYQR